MRKHEQVVEASDYPYHAVDKEWAQVWSLPILLFSSVGVIGLLALTGYTLTHWDAMSQWVEIVGVIISGLLSIRLYFYIDHKRHGKRMRDLAARKEEVEVRFKQAQIKFLEDASRNRANIETDSQGTIKATYFYPTPPRATVTEVQSEQKQIAPPQIKPALVSLPPEYDLLSVYKRIEISPENIFLAKDTNRDIITTDDADLCHGAFNAMTGGGKTSVERDLIAQLRYVGEEVILADLKFAPIVQTKQGMLDWRPLARSILRQAPIQIDDGSYVPCLVHQPTQIAALLHHQATTEINQRLQMRIQGDFSFKRRYVFLEELLALVQMYPGVIEDISRIIVLGRELQLFLFTAAQNFLVKDTKLSGGARENFQTAYFLGGDEHSGALLLDMSKKQLGDFLRTNNITLGKGVGMLRNNVRVPHAEVVRLGWASNEAIYYLHGRADDFVLPNGLPDRRSTFYSHAHQNFHRETVTGNLVNTVNRPDEPMEDLPGKTYQLLPIEVDRLVDLYRAYRSIDKCLRHMKKSNRYHQHASQIVKERGL